MYVIGEAMRACVPAHSPSHQCESVTAMPVIPGLPSALELAESWLCDTGTAYDLVPLSIANKHAYAIANAEPRTFQTANGRHKADKALNMQTPGLGSAGASAYIMKDTPCALSVGQRVMNNKYSYVWIEGHAPASYYPKRA